MKLILTEKCPKSFSSLNISWTSLKSATETSLLAWTYCWANVKHIHHSEQCMQISSSPSVLAGVELLRFNGLQLLDRRCVHSIVMMQTWEPAVPSRVSSYTEDCHWCQGSENKTGDVSILHASMTFVSWCVMRHQASEIGKVSTHTQVFLQMKLFLCVLAFHTGNRAFGNSSQGEHVQNVVSSVYRDFLELMTQMSAS